MTFSQNNNEHKEGNLYLQVMTTIALESQKPTATKTKALNHESSPLLKPKLEEAASSESHHQQISIEDEGNEP